MLTRNFEIRIQHLNIHLYISRAWYVSTKNTNGIGGFKKTWNIFYVLFHERLWPIRKGDWSKQLNVLNGWWTLVDLLRSWLHVRYSHYPKYLVIHVPNSNECLCNYLICLVSKISTFHWLFVMPNVPLWLIDQYNLYE